MIFNFEGVLLGPWYYYLLFRKSIIKDHAPASSFRSLVYNSAEQTTPWRGVSERERERSAVPVALAPLKRPREPPRRASHRRARELFVIAPTQDEACDVERTLRVTVLT